MTAGVDENRELRLEQLREQATALMDSLGALGPYAPTTSAPPWMRGLVAQMAAEVTHLIPEERYFPDGGAQGFRFHDVASVSEHVQTMLDARLILSLLLAATGRYSRAAFGFSR